MYRKIENEAVFDQAPYSQEFHLSDYLKIVWKRKWIIIAFLLVVVSIVAYKTSKTIPTYKATATILIEGQSFTLNEMKGITNTYLRQGDETKLELLQSRSLAGKIVEDMGLKEYYASRTHQKPDLLTLALRTVKKHIGKILSKPIPDTRKTLPAPLGERSESKHISKPKIQNRAVAYYLSKLKIASIPDTKLITISCEDRSPEMAARISNAHVRLFIERSIQVQNRDSKRALNWLKKQLNEQKLKLEAANSAVSKYKYIQLGLLPIEDDKVFTFPEIERNPVIRDSRNQLVRLKAQELEMSSKFGPKHPKMVEINSSIEGFKQVIIDEMLKIKASIKTELDRSVFSENPIQQTLGFQRQMAGLPAGDTINYYMLRLEEKSEREIYDILLKQTKEINLTGNIDNENFRIVDEAEIPRYPFKPNVFSNFLLSVVMGLALGIGFAFFIEYMDRTIKTPEDVMQNLEMSVIGVLPYEKSLKGNRQLALPSQECNDSQKKQINNYYNYNISNSLVSSLPLMPSGTAAKIFIVQSATSGEGKTTVLAKSAINMARGGLRVLMVDADLFQPSLHKLFGINNNNGHGGLLNSMEKIMSLRIRKGKLNECSVDDLFFLIALRRQSGRLVITDESQTQMTVLFEKGRLFCVQSQDTPFDNRLGTMLLRGNFITESQLKEALDRNKRTGQPLGYILVNAGYITQSKLQGPLKLQMEEHLQKLFSWKQGKFVFEPNSVETYEEKRIYFQEDYTPIINRLGRMVGSHLLESEVLSCARQVDGPNLSLIPAGMGNANAQGPLYSALISKYLDLLKPHYDVILVDAPPVLDTMGGAMPLLSLTDGIIFVVKAGKTSPIKVKDALRYMKDSKTKIIGTVLNHVKKGDSYYNKY